MKQIVLGIIALCLIISCSTQNIKSNLCGKKWYPDKFKDVDGSVYKFDKETKLLYTKFSCDGSFESWEDKGFIIKGTWTYDEKRGMVIMNSVDSKFPLDQYFRIISCDGKMLAFIKVDAGGQKVTVYSIAK